ncbi:hypothetical protein LB503_004206 [Fusarium chuoi]|nr:hypothetical protein LB503_004206 [Fusarium chuoi]
MATASRCPQGINVHEYLAFQTVASGKSRRWLSILAELASANLNFSNEATMLLVTHLALQCGPLDDSRGEFRIIHEVFRDRSFSWLLIGEKSTSWKPSSPSPSVSSTFPGPHVCPIFLTRQFRFCCVPGTHVCVGSSSFVLNPTRLSKLRQHDGSNSMVFGLLYCANAHMYLWPLAVLNSMIRLSRYSSRAVSR